MIRDCMSDAEHRQNSNDNCPCQEVQKHTDHFGQKGGLERQQRERLDPDGFRALSGTQRSPCFPLVTPCSYLSATLTHHHTALKVSAMLFWTELLCVLALKLGDRD